MSRYDVVRDAPSSAYISIGIPTYNGAERVSWLLQSIRSTGGLRSDAVLTVLDDGSPRPGEREYLLQLAEEHNTRLVRRPQNLGITASWNDLVNGSQSQLCILLNDDLFMQPRWLDNLVYFLENNECGAAAWNTLFCTKEDVPQLVRGEMVTPRHPHTKAHAPELGYQSLEEGPGVVMCALGCGFGFKRSTFNMVGGFDERMKQIYNESDFGTATASRGIPSYNIPAPRVWHLWSAAFKENPELNTKTQGDRAAYIAKWGGDFQGPNGTHPRFMHGTMPPRVVKWIGPDGITRERETTVQ